MWLLDRGIGMLNDESINVRVSVLETQMETVATDIAMIRANYATKQDVAEVRMGLVALTDRFNVEMPRMHAELAGLKLDVAQIKQRLDCELPQLGSKAELRQIKQQLDSELPLLATKAELLQIKQRLDSELPQLATKAELQQLLTSSRNWFVGMGVTLFFALAGLQLSLFSLYRNLPAPTALAAPAQPAPHVLPQPAPPAR